MGPTRLTFSLKEDWLLEEQEQDQRADLGAPVPARQRCLLWEHIEVSAGAGLGPPRTSRNPTGEALLFV